MKKMDLKDLDNYIMGKNIASTKDVLHRCPKCGGTKVIPMFFELGGWFYPPEVEDTGPWCSRCQREMTPV